ncbi:MAG: ABC transporter permease [Anaerolineae bacterium]|jgi:ribose transport system permease protein|nr:ABC transporter permease [Anaerolineae bacterium]
MQTTSAKPGGALAPQKTIWERIKGLFRITEFVLLLIIIGLFILGWVINPRFVNPGNLQILFRDTALLAIAAIGVGFTILTGGIDLSVGSIVGLAGVMSAYFMMTWKLPIWLSIILTLFLGLLIGLYHGLFVTKLKMHGFLITLVTMGLARGAILVLTNAFPITGLPRGFTNIGQEYVLGIPIPVLIAIVVAVVAYYLLRYTYIGRQIYAVGGNVDAARFSGVSVDKRIILCYIVSVVCASVVGMIQAARLSLGHPGSGEGYELLAITACILGGISFMGGQGGVIGIVVGALLIGTLQNLLVMVNVNPYWHKIVISLVLLAAITIDYARRRRRV